MFTVQNSNNPHNFDDLKMAITEYIRNVDSAILNTVFKNTVRRINKCLETDWLHFEHYIYTYIYIYTQIYIYIRLYVYKTF
jgi:6-pyruvoyl-tetrahydropterin synthase